MEITPNEFHNYFKEGVIYHAFSDHSGVTLYSVLSNEVFVAAVPLNDLISAFRKGDNVSEILQVIKIALTKKGFVRVEWH